MSFVSMIKCDLCGKMVPQNNAEVAPDHWYSLQELESCQLYHFCSLLHVERWANSRQDLERLNAHILATSDNPPKIYTCQSCKSTIWQGDLFQMPDFPIICPACGYRNTQNEV